MDLRRSGRSIHSGGCSDCRVVDELSLYNLLTGPLLASPRLSTFVISFLYFRLLSSLFIALFQSTSITAVKEAYAIAFTLNKFTVQIDLHLIYLFNKVNPGPRTANLPTTDPTVR